MGLNLDGKSYFVPGAFAVTKILQLGGQALPVFNVGVIIGKQMQGTPYTVGSGTPTQTAGATPITDWLNRRAPRLPLFQPSRT